MIRTATLVCGAVLFPQIATAMGLLLQIAMSWLRTLLRQGVLVLSAVSWLCVWWNRVPVPGAVVVLAVVLVLGAVSWLRACGDRVPVPGAGAG